MPITLGALFRRIVKDLQAQDNDPNSYLNNLKSDIYNPNYDINNPSSDINNKDSCINNQYNKELRRNVLRELLQLYLSDYLSKEQAEKLVTEYIP